MNLTTITLIIYWISYQRKTTVFRLGDSNLDLFKYEQHSPTDEFCNTFSSDNLLSHIIQPARINLLPMALLIIFTWLWLLSTPYWVILLPQYLTIPHNFLLPLIFCHIYVLQNQIPLKEIRSSLFKNTLFSTTFL